MKKIIKYLNENNIEYVKNNDKITCSIRNYTFEIIQDKRKYYIEKFKHGQSCSPIIDGTQTKVLNLISYAYNQESLFSFNYNN